MTETVNIDRGPVAKPKHAKVERRGKATVSASALAAHLDCSRAYFGKLEAEGVIHVAMATASRSMRAASPTCDTCDASGSGRRAVRPTPIFRRRRPS